MAFVYSILTALIFAVHSTTAFDLNIHEKMTKAERLAVFGSEDSDLQYEVFPMSLTGMRRKREARESISYTLAVYGEIVELNFKPTAQYLATKYIPVWSAVSDRHAYKKIRYTPLTTAMSDIGKVTMYQDFQRYQSALAVYTDRSEKIVIEGIISAEYVIRSLPKRLIGELLNVVDDISKIPNTMGGAITSYEDAGLFAIIKNLEDVYAARHIIPQLKTAKRQKGAKGKASERKIPKMIYPELFIVLDYNAIRHRTITQALRFTLACLNGIDGLFQSFNKPKVRLNIAGIIIAKDDMATPYIAEDTSVPKIGDLDSVISKTEKYFYEERVRFPAKQYDIILAMTTITLCPDRNCSYRDSFNRSTLVQGIKNVFCPSERNITGTKIITNSLIVNYDAIFGPAPIFVMWNTFNFRKDYQCHSEYGYTISYENPRQYKCTQKLYSDTFTMKETDCYRNKPRPIQQVGKVLSGMWLSMDGQCQNEGFKKSCKLKKKIGTCRAKGCRAKGSKKCVRSKKVPLPGSKCGTHKYCNKKKICVKK